MEPQLRDRIINRLESDYGLKQAAGTNWHRNGRCPACGKKELYTSSEAPWVIRCGRVNKCGGEWRAQDLYADFFNDWSERYKPTPQEPNNTALHYLTIGRGFEATRVIGEFNQENYFNPELGIGSATVRFPLPNGGWWERLIDRPERFGKVKARAKPGHSYRGDAWLPGTCDLEGAEDIYIVEGIFDALALIHAGKTAVSAISCSNFPENFLSLVIKLRGGSLPRIIFGYDADPAGIDFTHKAVRKANTMGFVATAAQILETDPKGKRRDWNDMLQLGKLDDKFIARTLQNGGILLANSPHERGRLMYLQNERQQFWFEHRNRTYYWNLDLAKYDKAMQQLEEANQGMTDEELRERAIGQSGTVREICNCYPQCLYHQRNEVTDESWYYFRIRFPHDGQEHNCPFTPAQIASAGDFKKRLLALPGAFWQGSQAQLDELMRTQTYQIKSVDTIDFQGFSRKHGAWILGRHAIANGEVFEMNSEDYFEIGRTRIKSLCQPSFLLNPSPADYRQDWFDLLWQCFSAQGVIALAFWTGSLFAEHIRASQKSYPFLELTGEAGAGKTTLIKFLWKLMGRTGDHEGFDPSKSTVAGRARIMGQVSTMPVVFIEADRNEPDRHHQKGFDWDELKDFFGGGTIRSRGMRTAGNETYEPPFRGTIAIAQNADVDASEAILSRIVKLAFKRPRATAESRAAAKAMEAMDADHLSWFAMNAMRNERSFLGIFENRFKIWEAKLREVEGIRMERIIKNHAQIGALVDALHHLINIPLDRLNQVHAQIPVLALSRQEAMAADHPKVSEFWDVFEYLDETLSASTGFGLNHSQNENQIAVNLNEIAEQAGFHRQQLADMKELRALLKNSRRHKFIDSNVAIHSRVRQANNATATLKCWVFKKSHAAT